jgi:hypothetical protein
LNLSQTIRRYLGWCPNTHSRSLTADIRPDIETATPPKGGSYKDRAIHWLGLFRNQTMLQTIGTFCAGFFMFACLAGGSDLNLFIIGILAGLPFSVIVGIWYRRIFDEVLREGQVVLWNRYDKTLWTLTGLAVMVSACIWALVLFGVIPGIDLNMITAFFGGVVTVSFWGLLIIVQKWESCTHRRLHYNGTILRL